MPEPTKEGAGDPAPPAMRALRGREHAAVALPGTGLGEQDREGSALPAEGLGNAAIADRLVDQPRDGQAPLGAILRKPHLEDRTQAVRAWRRGMVVERGRGVGRAR
ncbi:MAG: hypothetical protein M3Q10_06015 [Chloroflexota bacterium]|nr:hypothetical protein [Chloroflexota bacterium]